MKLIDKEYLDKLDSNCYVWYACYGSNINFKRFMYYINGDENEKYSTNKGCTDKSLPIEERKYIFNRPIYFAGKSKRWGGGMAFLDYEHAGKSYGKIYKLKLSQFKEILQQEQSNRLYDAILLIDYIDKIPVLTFTAKYKLKNLANPSDKYIKVIEDGLIDLYDNLDKKEIEEYLKSSIDNNCEK